MLRKLLLNFGLRAVRIMGFGNYLKYLFLFLTHLPTIIRTRKLTVIDAYMTGAYKVNWEGHRFTIDCGFADKVVKDGSYTFGGIKEIYVRDCYFRHLRHKIDWDNIRTVVDLGGNRGLFSTMAASFAKKVVYVEAEEKFRPIIEHHCLINEFSNIRTYFKFVGAGGSSGGSFAPEQTISLEKIMSENGMERIDLLKMDIEGSEFALIREFKEIGKVGVITMEIHPAFGDLREFFDTLQRNGFSVTLCDENLAVVPEPDPLRVSFLYAVNTKK